MPFVCFVLSFFVDLFICVPPNLFSLQDGRRILPSGAVYSGTFANKQFDGQGEMRWPAPISATYTGQWRAGLRNGEGVYVQQPGGEESGRWLRYEGQWLRGVRHGTAEMSSSNGERFEGQFENGLMTGDGVLRTATGDVYEGQWKNGAYDGVGTFSIPSIGYEYTGEVAKGKAQGTGVERVGTGEMYRGQFHDDRRHGKGSALLPSGDAYRGQWYRGQFHGVGEYVACSASFGNFIPLRIAFHPNPFPDFDSLHRCT